MKQLSSAILLLFSLVLHAQVGINTTDPKANLDVVGNPTNTSSPDGIIPPRLTRNQLISKSTVYNVDQIGALVYVTDTSGTTNTATANVTAAGMYFFDGSVWQRIDSYAETTHTVSTSANTLTSTVDGVTDTTSLISTVQNTSSGNNLNTSINGILGSNVSLISSNQMTVSGNTLTNTINGVVSNSATVPNLYTANGTLTGNRTVYMNTQTLAFTSSASTGTSHFTIDGTTFNVDAVNNRIGIGNSSPVARLDIRTNPGDTSDPGEGYLGIGTTNTNASSAGAGAVRYSTSDGGVLEYSNGSSWNTLTSSIQKSVVIAKKSSSQTINNNSTSTITNWTEITDLNNDFTYSNGRFYAPRTGNYVVSFSFDFGSGNISGGTQVEAMLIVYSSGGTELSNKKSVVSYPSGGTAQAGGSISFAIRMNEGEYVVPAIWHNLGTSKSLRVPGNQYDDGFVNFSVVEL